MNKTENIISSGCSWVWGPYDFDLEQRVKNRDNDLSDDEGWLTEFQSSNLLMRQRDKVNLNMKKEDALLYSFSQQLANKLNIPCYNVASSGASNDYIFEKLYDIIKQENLYNSFVVVGLTEPSRFYFGSRTFKFTDSGNDHWEWRKTFFEHYYCERSRIKYIIMMCDLFSEWLKNRNSKFVVFNSFCEDINYPERDYFFKKFKTWEDYIKSYDKQYKRGKHPIEYDHKILCNLLYEEYFYKKI